MAKPRTISYRNTAILSLVGGIVSLAVAIGDLVGLVSGTEYGMAGTIIGTVALVAWFLGGAAGVLALSTEYRRMAAVGLVLCALALLLFVLNPTIAGS